MSLLLLLTGAVKKVVGKGYREKPKFEEGYYDQIQTDLNKRILREDQEIMDLIAIVVKSGTL